MIDASLAAPRAAVPRRRLPVTSANRVILAVDLGTTTGWAMAVPDTGIVSGTVSFRPSRYDGGGVRYLRFRAWLDGIAEDMPSIQAIHFEEVRRHLSTDAAHVHGGLLATLTTWCEERTNRIPGRACRHHQTLHRRQG
jgi:crossover junction endodeoxyribonuclease RuvC